MSVLDEDAALEAVEQTQPTYPFNTATRELHELYVGAVRLEHVPSSLDFHRDFVAPGQPVVIGAAAEPLAAWPAMQRGAWDTDAYLVDKIGADALLDVNVTPTGYGDAVYHRTTGSPLFVMPCEQKLRFEDALRAVQGDDGVAGAAAGVPYISAQNSSFSSPVFHSLRDDVVELAFAREAFGSEPDAINIWIGHADAVSSMHKDPYCNIYCVVRGEKRFTLVPPLDTFWFGARKYPVASFVVSDEDGSFGVTDASTTEEERVFWIPVEVGGQKQGRMLCLEHALEGVRECDCAAGVPHDVSLDRLEPFEVVVRAGEVLYLPELWYHKVENVASGTIAVNFWYNMPFTDRWVAYQFMRRAAEARTTVIQHDS